MILIWQRIVPRSRTHTGSRWEATSEADGHTYSAASRHGAPQALARVLVAAGIADQPVEVRSEVCIFDNGDEIRTDEPHGCIRYRSLHAMASWACTEGDRPLRRIPYRQRPEGLFLPRGDGEKAFHRSPDDVVVIPEPEPLETDLRICVSCGGDFSPTRQAARFCSPA